MKQLHDLSITTPDRVKSRIGTLEFTDGISSRETLDKVYDHPDFTRDCRGLEELTPGFCMLVEDTEFVIPRGATATIVEREYLKVGAQRGPDSALTLPSVVLKLHRPGQGGSGRAADRRARRRSGSGGRRKGGPLALAGWIGGGD